MTKLELQTIPDNTELQNGITVLEKIPGLGVKISRVVFGCAPCVQFLHYNDQAAYAGWQEKPKKKPPFVATLGTFKVAEQFILGSPVFRLSMGGYAGALLDIKHLPDLITLLNQLAEYRKDEL